MTSTFTLLEPKAFLADAIAAINTAEKRIFVLTMILDRDSTTEPFFTAIEQAAKRGIPVEMAADTFTYTELSGHFHLSSQFNEEIRAVMNIRRHLAKHGVHFNWLGNYASTLITGRTHSKWLVIDDVVYSFGGINLYKVGFSHTDFMIKTTDATIANRLLQEQTRILAADKAGHAYRSYSFGDEINRVLVDGGFLGDSIVYRRACRLITQSKRVTYVSQYCPTGKLGRLLKKVDSKLYFNPWNKADSMNAVFIRLASYFSGHVTNYTRDNYLHSKFILFELTTGEKVAITGSHNFANGGIWLGTREIALETRDPQLIAQLERFFRHHIA